MIDTEIRLTGVDEVKRALELLPQNVARNVLRVGVREGAKPMRTAMRQAAPIRKEGGWKRIKAKGAFYRSPGFLKKRFGYKYLKKRSSKTEIHYGVGPFGWAYYGFIVARGHIVGARKEAKRRKTRGLIGLPRVPAYDFMTPVFNQQSRRALDAMVKGFEIGILKEAKKLGINTQAYSAVPFSVA